MRPRSQLLLGLTYLLVCLATGVSLEHSKRVLPEKLLVAYPGHSKCGPLVQEAIDRGVNVIAWSFGKLLLDDSGEPYVVVGPDVDCVLGIANNNTNVVQLLSLGGWDTPHPNTTCDGARYYGAWKDWNESIQRADGTPLFDGFDWDLEGNDDTASPDNGFTVDVLDIMGVMSQLAKRDGYFVALAPAESYLDPRAPVTEPSFNRSLLLTYPSWERQFKEDLGANYTYPFFAYHGRNSWAFLLAAYGGLGPGRTFDFASIQVYESYSHIGYDLQVLGMSVSHAIICAVLPYLENYWVDFSTDDSPRVASLGKQKISIPHEGLVVGFIAYSGNPRQEIPRSYPYAKGVTFMPTDGDSVQSAYKELEMKGTPPRGFMYWCILDEAGSTIPYYMSSGLATVMGLSNQ